MPSSTVRNVADVDELGQAVRGTNVQMTMTQPGDFAAKVVRVDLHRLLMQRAEENAPRIMQAVQTAGRVAIVFVAPHSMSKIWNGEELPSSALAVQPANISYRYRTVGPTRWGSLTLPEDDFAELGITIMGRDLSGSRVGYLVTPPAEAMATLVRLHAAAAQLAENAPEIVADERAAAGLEGALTGAILACFDAADPPPPPSARGRHNAIMKRFRAVIEANADRAIFIPEMCKAVGVSERILRACCHDHLGMGPKRYLLLRRMHMAHRELRQGDAANTSVTRVATQCGFWELGRFAVEYRRLFGESPSATLSSEAEGSRPARIAAASRYAHATAGRTVLSA